MKALLPPSWPRPKGYSNGIAARGRLIFTAGVVGWDEHEKFPPDFTGQLRQLLKNILAILAEDAAGPQHIVRLTWYITDRHEYEGNLREVGEIYRELMGKNYPAMAVVEVSALMEPEAKLEIEATAVVPE